MPDSFDLLNLSQAIANAHQRSFERQETLLREIRDQPQRFLDIAHYEQRHQELERRVGVLEAGLQDLVKQIQEVPEKIMEKIEARTGASRTQIITISIALANGLIAITLGVLNALRH